MVIMGGAGCEAFVVYFKFLSLLSLDENVKVKAKVKLSLCLNKHHAMKTYWGVEVKLHAFLTLAPHGDEWSASFPGSFTPQGKIPRYPLGRRQEAKSIVAEYTEQWNSAHGVGFKCGMC
jgi:hypothetical protein